MVLLASGFMPPADFRIAAAARTLPGGRLLAMLIAIPSHTPAGNPGGGGGSPQVNAPVADVLAARARPWLRSLP